MQGSVAFGKTLRTCKNLFLSWENLSIIWETIISQLGKVHYKIDSSFGIFCSRVFGLWKNIANIVEHLFLSWETFVSQLENIHY